MQADEKKQRNIFIRESSSKMYSQIVFALCQLLAEIPYSILCAVVFYLLVRRASVRVRASLTRISSVLLPYGLQHGSFARWLPVLCHPNHRSAFFR